MSYKGIIITQDTLLESTYTHEPTREELDFLNLTGAKGMHEQGFTGQGVKVAVIDSGIYAEHSCFRGIKELQEIILVPGYTGDANGHGTHVCGTIGGSDGIGLAPNLDGLISYHCLDWMGGGESLEKIMEYINESIHDAITREVDIISMSLGIPETELVAKGLLQEFHQAVQAADQAGVAVIVSAGNEGDSYSIRYPGFFEEPITVGALDEWYAPAAFSSVHEEVDVCQVGVDVMSAAHYDRDNKNGYVKMSGTSMATPIVSGMAALIISKYKAQNNGQRMPVEILYQMLLHHAVDLHEPGFDTKTGVGFVTFKENIKTMYFPYGQNVMVINGNSINIPQGIKNVQADNGETKAMLPVREDNEEQGNSVTWKPDGVTIRC